ncbi:MAG: YggS family pyridoxal phosphate-dependent enzyme [Pseudomonadota bacterium]
MDNKADPAQNYLAVLEQIRLHAEKHDQREPELITVSKTFTSEIIRPVLRAGARVFGENRVQEAQGKWPDLKEEFPDLELHLIGPLQSNKASDAVALFDCIQTVDREKIARVIAVEMQKQNRRPKLFLQVNTGSEPQKAGVLPEAAVEFCNWCQNDEKLEISGLMCIPPFDENPGPHFALLRKLAQECGVQNLSMGMSSDYLTATEFGATHVRVGSAIFGAR